MSLSYYHRSRSGQVYSHGVLIQTIRDVWPWIVLLMVLGALIGTFEGRTDSFVILLALLAGLWSGWHRARS